MMPGRKGDEAGETAITKILLKEIVDERLKRYEFHGNEGFEQADDTPYCSVKEDGMHVLAAGLR